MVLRVVMADLSDMKPLAKDDIRAGLPVQYNTHDGERPWIKSEIEDPKIFIHDNDECIRLVAKHHARLSRIYVSNSVAIGTKDDGEAGAAIGAKDAAGGENNPTPTSKVMEDDPQTFVHEAYVPWLQALIDKCANEGQKLPAGLLSAIKEKYRNLEDAIVALKEVVPMKEGGYVNFHGIPKTSKNGCVHPSFLSLENSAYPGNGIYLTDVKLLLANTSIDVLLSQTVHLRPRGVETYKFGWEADGPVVNGAHAFLRASIAWYACLVGRPLPQPLAQQLSSIPAHYERMPDARNRLLNNLVASEAARFANRTISDPVFLSEELERSNFNPAMVSPFVKLYRQRTLANPGLAMPRRMEDATVRIMSPEKIAAKTRDAFADIVAKYSWDKGPLNLKKIISGFLPINANLNDSCHDIWQSFAKQSAAGQLSATRICEQECQVQHSQCSGTQRFDDDAWDELLVACGLWEHVREKMLPTCLFSAEKITALDHEFSSDAVFRAEFVTLARKEPPAAVATMSDLTTWVIANTPGLKRSKREIDATANAGGASSMSFMLGREEAKSISGANYWSQMCLDMHHYSEALTKLDDDNASAKSAWERANDAHIKDVQRFQKSMQSSDVSHWQPEARVGTNNNNKWLHEAVQAAAVHHRKLKTLHRFSDDDVLLVHVFQLHALGTAKRNVLEQIAKILPQLKGLVLIFYPLIPKKLHRVTMPEAAEVNAEATNGTDDLDADCPDVDPETHDFDANGALPDAITAQHSVRTPHQRAAQLALDWNVVDNTLGMADIGARYPRRLTFLHEADSAGDRGSTSALVLIPLEECPGVVLHKLEESAMFSSGNYVNVPVPDHFVKVSKKICMQAKRAMQEHYSFDSSERDLQGARFAASKVSRAQLGTAIHEVWMKDILTTCGVKCMTVNDYAHGSGEVQAAAVNCKVSAEATAANVRVCSWAHDPRPIFAGIGDARSRSSVARYYLSKHLSLPGHVAAPSPGAPAAKSRRLMASLLRQPLKLLTMDAECNILVPTDAEIRRSCPVVLPAEASVMLKQWQEKYPRPDAPAIGGDNNDNAGQGQGQGEGQGQGQDGDGAAIGASNGEGNSGNSATAENAGACVASLAELEKLGEKIAAEISLPDPKGQIKDLRLALAVTKDNKRRVWIHNIGKKDIVLPVNTYLGRGGNGAFVSLVAGPLSENQKGFAWKFNRLTSHKRDLAESANGYVVWSKDADAKPNLATLDCIEKQLQSPNITVYAHSITRGGQTTRVTIVPSPTPIFWVPDQPPPEDAKFDWQSLGAWLPTGDDVEASGARLSGLVRPAFELVSTAKPGNAISLAPNPGNASNPLYLFTNVKTTVAAGAYLALHAA